MMLSLDFSQIIPERELNQLYVYLDICFLVVFLGLLAYTKRYLTTIFALAGGVIYFVVDYGIFYLFLGTRIVEGASYFWFLLWLSMSYGITNFAWIWLWIKKDKHLLKWSLLIFFWWLICPIIARVFGAEFGEIAIQRGTTQYHWVMAFFLVLGYGIIVVHNIRTKDKEKRIDILWLLAIGILVQLGWEFALFVTGIRQGGFSILIVNSLLETNMGIPYIYFIYRKITKHYQEDLSKPESLATLATI